MAPEKEEEVLGSPRLEMRGEQVFSLLFGTLQVLEVQCTATTHGLAEDLTFYSIKAILNFPELDKTLDMGSCVYIYQGPSKP